MSKRKRRRREEIRREDINNTAPFGINPAQLMNLLGNNIDFNQIGNMISSMKVDGLDLNNFNLNHKNNTQPNRTGFDLGPLQGFMNGLGLGGNNLPNNNSNIFGTVNNNHKGFEVEEVNEEHKNNFEESFQEEEFLEEDENIQMLIAIKSIVDSKKAHFLDRVIEEYNKGNFK
ncbi:hypothetical protein [uncultured Clostridium sp.]|uniref:hypothetical protein n=1 Tax=uncultured Clostridium sp. TaxID=59620 RepID=UPI00259000B2|nr:hypothetical protein [uncultured Clostridium sp.]